MENNIGVLPFSNSVKEKLEFLIDKIVSTTDSVIKVVLFGSYARCDYKVTSDLDLLVVTTEKLAQGTRGELSSVFDDCNADVIFYTEEQLEQSTCMLVNEIRKDGILLWKK
ncbi:MAG: nucleotidyltransferase domain-containing protein [Clostridium sp.]|nr:nucleotidyltransferase domain-containing protein [Clostridium sp.]MCM1207509.1 nucleotidyltransferase domain-containing protein [Ruminococcus sp.]